MWAKKSNVARSIPLHVKENQGKSKDPELQWIKHESYRITGNLIKIIIQTIIAIICDNSFKFSFKKKTEMYN